MPSSDGPTTRCSLRAGFGEPRRRAARRRTRGIPPALLPQAIIDRLHTALEGTNGTLTGVAAVDRDFLHALFGSFPYVLAGILILTLILLTRAFRSPVLAVMAVVLNLLSLAAAFGIVVFVFQQGHGSSLWDIEATGSITAWIPVMIFAFLFGLSMEPSRRALAPASPRSTWCGGPSDRSAMRTRYGTCRSVATGAPSTQRKATARSG